MDKNTQNSYLESDALHGNEIQISKLNKENEKVSICDNKLEFVILVLLIIIIISIVINYIHLFSIRYSVNENRQNLNKSILIIQNSFNNLSTDIRNVEKRINRRFNKYFPKFQLKKSIKDAIFYQKDFCLNPKDYYDQTIENLIIQADVNISEYQYKMFVYNVKQHFDFVSDSIIRSHHYEKEIFFKMRNAIQYYAQKNNITDNRNITVLDIGANIGCHTLIFAKYNYTVIGFEASEKNYYILRKNICINNLTNTIIFNVGLYDEEKECSLYIKSRNYGDGELICDGDKNISAGFIKDSELYLTKISNYLPYLIKKNLVLIKIDIEGAEGRVMKDGIELISKYHVPFIETEYSASSLNKSGISPRDFIEMFLNNGYKMSKNDFFPNKTDTIENILKEKLINLYFVYKDYAK